MARLTMDEGEWGTAAIDLTGLPAPWDDLAGAVVELSADGPAGQPMTPVAGDLDEPGADGKRHAAFAVIPPSWGEGLYFCTLEVAKRGDDGKPLSGWPQKQSFDLEIKPVARKPTPA